MKVLLRFVLFVSIFECYVFAKKFPPLLEDRGHRKVHLSYGECQFAKQHKELGSTWFADLGPPFDVMYCIKCECLKVLKEGRVYGHVKCKNIAKDCPELTCEDQIQVVGRCCKVCRNDTELTEVLQDVTPVNFSDEEEKSHKHYAAVLTGTFYSLYKGSGNMSSVGSSIGQTATGRFTLHKKNLYFSFYTSMFPLASRPISVQFIDNVANIVEEQQIPSSGSLYQNLTNKVCGVWRRVPSEYRTLLKEEKLSVVLVWEEYDVKIRGTMMRYRPLTTEVFTSLMVSTNDSVAMDGVGTAIVSISTTVTPSIYVMVVFTGLLSSKRKNDNLLVLRLFAEDKTTAVFEETISVEKPSSELNVIEYSTAVSIADLQALTQQRLSVSLLSAKYKDSKIVGKLVSRVQCELFQAVLSSQHQSLANTRYSQKSTRASGIAWMFFNRYNALQYFVNMDNVVDVTVELVTARHQNVIENLIPTSNWANSSVASLAPKYVEQLYGEELVVNVAKVNGNNPSLIRGRLVSRPVADSRDSATPYLLKRSDTSVPTDMVGLIWARIDTECNMNYDVTIVGKDLDDHQFELYLEDIPFVAPGAPVTRRLLEEFTGPNAEGFLYGLSQNELIRLETGVVYLDIWDMKRGQSILRTKWEKISIPATCLPRNPENSTADNNIPSYRLLHDENEQPEVPKCFHGSQFYDHGSQWTSTTDKCTMCYCYHGVTKCDPILCPDLTCSQKFTNRGSCCQSCHNVTDMNFSQNSCSLGGQSYIPGSVWYPYIPPNGFATCTICSCDISSLKVKCGRVECPPLNCDEKLAFRSDKKSCCKICSNKTKTAGYDIAIADQQDPAKYDRDILQAGGCKYPYGGPYENGKEWHPRIYFHGVERCVTCRCKDGKVSCERKKCTKHSCEDQCCMKKSKCNKLKRTQDEIRKLERD